ncbi:MAG: endonuclease [Fibrobacter sp.]|nr:endonuclease [Fibrobacter sp.]
MGRKEATLLGSLFIAAIGLLCCCTQSFAKIKRDAPPQHYNYRDASKVMKRIYYGDLQETLYCGCKYENKKSVDFSTCDFEPRDNPRRKSLKRAQRIEWEHIVPAYNMAHFLPCWKEGGRKNCSQNDTTFKIMEGDLHNLYPAIGEVNGDRNNFPYSQWTSDPTPMYGKCKTIVDFKEKKIQPREEARGIVARASLYMEKTYGVKLSKQDRKLFDAWNRMYPVTERECERDRRIFLVQGDHNPFVYENCKQ